MTALPTTSQLAGAPASQLRLGQWGWWNRVDLNMNSRGPLGTQEVVESNPLLVVGFQSFQLELLATGDHDVTIELVLCDPFTGLAIANFPAVLLGQSVSGITDLFVTTFGDGFGFPMLVVGAWHTFLLRFTVNDTLTGTKLSADVRGAG